MIHSSLSNELLRDQAGETEWSQLGRMEVLRSFGYPKMLRRTGAMAMTLFTSDDPQLIIERAVEKPGWRDRAEPVRKNGSPQIPKDVASDISNVGYDIVQVLMIHTVPILLV
jgi:hypothetical protein